MAEPTGTIEYEVIVKTDQAEEGLRRVQTQTERAISGFRTASRAIGIVGSVLTQVSILSFVYNLVQRRVESATLRVAEAQRRYEEALARWGPMGAKTIAALRRLRMAQSDLTRAQREASVQQVLMIFQAGMLGIRFLELAANVHRYMTSVQLATIADVLHCKVLGVKVGLIAAATAGIGALVGALAYYAWQARAAEIVGALPTVPRGRTLAIRHEAEFTIRDEREVDRVYAEMGRQVKAELRRFR